MSLKRRPKIQHVASPKSSIQKQINQGLQRNSQSITNIQNSLQKHLLQKMQQKIAIIFEAYQRLEDQSQRKDGIIKQLEDQNYLLKQRLTEKYNQIKPFNFQVTQSRKQVFQGQMLQRSFASLEKNNDSKIAREFTSQTSELKLPATSSSRQSDSKTQINRVLKQSRSLEGLSKVNININKPLPNQSSFSNFQSINSINEQQTKMLTKRDENQLPYSKIDEDKSFMDVLNKLKNKISNFDEEDLPSLKKGHGKQFGEENNLKLSKAKSSKNLSRKSINYRESKEQTEALKNIWNQRDKQIKRMDQLFSKIDECINVTQNQ